METTFLFVSRGGLSCAVLILAYRLRELQRQIEILRGVRDRTAFSTMTGEDYVFNVMMTVQTNYASLELGEPDVLMFVNKSRARLFNAPHKEK